jgi:hypothetical protein
LYYDTYLIGVFDNTVKQCFRKEENMGKRVHTSKITITRVGGPTRKAVIEGFKEPIFYGVHGGIKQFYGVEPKEEHPATLDHIIGGVGG